MLILGIILFGMVVGAGAQLILGRARGGIDWTMAIVAGLVGSFVGGLLISLLAGDGLDLKPSGIIGSLVGRSQQVARGGGPGGQAVGRPPQAQPALSRPTGVRTTCASA
jgi:uncharacterized membrane protein YeaQ/YmgE (transglycosylase-associated protein family)